MADSNGTITVEELKKLLEEWNLVIGFLFLTWICLLQFAYANRNRFLYIIKLIFLWLLWPVTLTCFVLAAVYRINWITGGIAIAMACLVLDVAQLLHCFFQTVCAYAFHVVI